MKQSNFVIELMDILLDGEETIEWRIIGANGFLYIPSKLRVMPNQRKISKGSFC
jgi:hypothetical protein